MKDYFDDYQTQEAFEFYAEEEWKMEHDSNANDDPDAYEAWVDDHYDEIVDVMNEMREESEGYYDELLEEDPDFFESW